MSEFHHKIVPELKAAQEGKYKVGFERVIRAVVNYVRALPKVDDFESISKDVFGSDLQDEAKVKRLKEAVKYFYKGSKEGHVKQKITPSKKTIQMPKEPDKVQKTAETDLVERIALDLDQLDLNETVEKVKQELNHDSLVQALASGAEVAPSAEGKYPHHHGDKGSQVAIKIPPVHFEVKKTAIERHRLGQMSPYIYQLLTKGNETYKKLVGFQFIFMIFLGEIKLPVVVESDVLPEIHRFYQPLRSRIYAILFNLYHARFDRRQLEEKVKGMRRKADELRRAAKKNEEKAEELRSQANTLMQEANETKLGEMIQFKVREWLPYDNYEKPDLIEACELHWPIPTVQRLWFGTVQDDKQKRIQAFLSCLFCDDLPHGNLPPHLLLMACVLKYMLVVGGSVPVLRKPELDAFLATAMSAELRNVAYLAEMRLEMVTIRGVHLAAIFMQVTRLSLFSFH